KLFSGDLARAEKLLEDAFLPKEATQTAVNEWLINTGDKLVLVDAGTSNVFAPTLGRLPQSLAAAGVDPNAVDVVILTHMHPDHVPGLLSTDKKVLFKNAVVHVNGTEYAYWTSDDSPPRRALWPRRALLALRDQRHVIPKTHSGVGC